jgi:hypothetical protein
MDTVFGVNGWRRRRIRSGCKQRTEAPVKLVCSALLRRTLGLDWISTFIGGFRYSRERGGFERISTWLNLTFDISSFAAHSKQVLEANVVWLQFLIGDTPVLNSQVWIQDLFAVSLLDVRLVRLQPENTKSDHSSGPRFPPNQFPVETSLLPA